MFFRRRQLVRAIACFFLLETLSSILAPTVTWAMMGPSQPEFTAYEAPGSTDMVNLSSGDFSYSIPLLDIPGPERSFSLPLSYKAGIPLEQEASWVGLGWSLNPGALARNMVGYADDAAHDTVNTSYTKQIDRGWNLNWGIVSYGWSVNTGSYGSVDLLGLASVNWDRNGVQGGDLVGIGYQAGQGFKVDPVRMVMAAVTIATLGAGSAVAVAQNVGIALLTSAGIGVGMAAAGIGRMGGVSGFNSKPTRRTQPIMFGTATEYWEFFNNNATEYAYGSLHFGDMSRNKPNFWNEQLESSPTFTVNGSSIGKAQPFHNVRACNENGNVTSETAADIHQHRANSEENYYETNSRPLSTAHDYFCVMGEGVSGSIRPYRLDMGSVAYPQMGIDGCHHYKYSVVDFLPEQQYKVGFRYDNSLSNSYDYHNYSPANGYDLSGFDPTPNGNTITINDSRLQSNGARTEAARIGLYDGTGGSNRRLVQGKHVVWYTNQEIKSMYANSTNGIGNGFLEFAHPVAANGSNNPFRERLRPTAIGAFAITSEDGTTYHYSLPVHQFKIHSQSDEVNSTVGSPGKYTRNERGHVTTWLLTAITSSDYIDRNQSGTLDAGDWGGWVNFQYGKFSAAYKWRQPYIGTSYGDDDPAMGMASFTEGYKETYYLNSIATRSHTALFVKSVREDGRGHFQAGVWPGGTNRGNLGIDERTPCSSLRLDEVILLDNATLSQVQTPDGIRAPNDPNPVPAFTNTTAVGTFPNGPISSYDRPENVLDVNDLNVDSRIKSFVYSNAIRRIRFNYGYDLCRGTPSSFPYPWSTNGASLPPMTEAELGSGRGGKLTLKSVSTFGPTVSGVQTKVIPDFAFEYGGEANNPRYQKEWWDAFGMYLPYAARNTTSHVPNIYNERAQAWSLNKIISPLGGSTTISYERDEYAHVSEFGTSKIRLINSDGSRSFRVDASGFNGDMTKYLQADAWLLINGKSLYSCASSLISYPIITKYNCKLVQVESSYIQNGNYMVRLKPAYQPQPPSTPTSGIFQCTGGITPVETKVEVALPENKAGGDLRVARISTSDESGAVYQVRYFYKTGDLNATRVGGGRIMDNSSGVIAKEPGFLNRFEYSFEGDADYAATPVLYGKVTVLRGLFKANDNDWDQREVYTFHTPQSNMVSNTLTSNWSPLSNGQNVDIITNNNRTIVDAGLVGQPKKVEVFNRNGQVELSTEFDYSNTIANNLNRPNQGRFTEALLSHELLSKANYRINRTVKEYVPTVMSGSRSTRNGVTINNSNLLYDFYTGQVIETGFRDSRGNMFHSRSVPAYTIYPGMGAKGDNISNSHMLAQQGAFYSYKEKAGGTAYSSADPLNPRAVGILSAGIQLWQNNWSGYRAINNLGIYEDEVGPQINVWRQSTGYSWHSPLVNPDGTFGKFINFAWAGSNATEWVKGGEAARYDHFSHSLEARDMNGLYSANKMGYNHTQIIASASPARFTELAYSGAEDRVGPGFGGEILSQGTQDPDFAHSGNFSVRASAGQMGFFYQGLGGRDIYLNKPYRLSVWIHASDAIARAGELFVEAAGTVLASANIASAGTRKAGDWYRVEMVTSLPPGVNNQTVRVGCRNTGPSNSVRFDDFRFSPLQSTCSSSVYDSQNGKPTFVLDNENLYTRYEYDKTGKLKRIYRESFDRNGSAAPTSRLVKEYEYNHAQQRKPTWTTTSYECVYINGSRTPNGDEVRIETDTNPLSDTYGSTRRVPNGTSTRCVPPVCPTVTDPNQPPVKFINDQCETAGSVTSNCYDCTYTVTTGGRTQTLAGKYVARIWRFSDGSTLPSTTPCGIVMLTDCGTTTGGSSGGGGNGGGHGGAGGGNGNGNKTPLASDPTKTLMQIIRK